MQVVTPTGGQTWISHRRQPFHVTAMQVMVNVTSSSGGCCSLMDAGGLDVAAGVVDAVMGPPEAEAAFGRITDKCVR